MSTTVGTGGASIVSRMWGKGDKEDAANVTSNAMLIFWIFAIVCTVLGLLFIEPLLYILGCTDSLMSYAKGYARIILLGAITSTAFSAIIRAEGDTKFSMYMWMVPVIANLILDPFFIFVLEWGVKGAALGTICAQMISAVMSAYFFFFKKRESYFIKRENFKLRIHIVEEIFAIGFPALALSAGGSIFAILVNNILKSQGGDIAITAYGIVSKIYGFFIMPCSGIVQGMQPIVGYNFGMGDFKRVRNAMKLSMISMLAYGALIAVLGYMLKVPLIRLFIQERKVQSLAFDIFSFLLLTMPIAGIPTLISSYYQSVGKARIAMMIPIVNMIVIQIPVMYIMSGLMAMNGVWLAFIMSDILRLLFVISIYFRKGQRDGKQDKE